MAFENAILFTLFAITPFLVTSFTYELFEFPKMMFVYATTVLLVAARLTRSVIPAKAGTQLLDPRSGSGMTRLLVVTFLIVNLISTIFSQYLHTSVWGYYSRFSGGLVSTICYIMIFFVLTTLDKKRLVTLLKLVVYTSAIVSLYAISQHFGFEKDRWVQDVSARVFSSFGQPNWLAAFLVLVIPVNLHLLVDEKDVSKKSAWFITALLNFSALWFTFSLSGLAGFFLSVLIFFIFLEEKVRKTNLKLLVTLAVLWTLTALLQPGLAQSRFEDAFKTIQKRVSLITPALAATSNYAVGDTGDIRLIVWRGVLNQVFSNSKSLLIGTGPETIAFSFLPFRPTGMNNTSEGSFLYNKAHNYFLDLLSNLGLLGLLSYLALNVAAVATCFKNRSDVLLLAIGTALIGNAVTNFFGWPTVMTNLLFFLYLATLSSQTPRSGIQ